MTEEITLILGAGASLAMGYPTGAELRQEIINRTLEHSSVICSRSLNIHEDQLEDFVNEFEKSQMISIDSFLARRTEFSEIGKRTIAALLLERENKKLLIRNENNDNWYLYFYNQVAASESWKNLNFKHISIITFNYDRSLEHYLLYAMSSSYGKSLKDAYEKLKEMKIIHVYGSLGTSDITNSEYFEYETHISQKIVSMAASNIKVIPEGRNDDTYLKRAREILLQSDKIAFLGFGFDTINLERLDSLNTCNQITSSKQRKIVGTIYGMTQAEAIRAIKSTADPYCNKERFLINNNAFLDKNCTSLLRETSILLSE